MSPWPWISNLGRASLEGALLILAVWAICRAWSGFPAWARSGLWWLASARLLVALVPLTSVSIPAPPPVIAQWWPSAIASPPASPEVHLGPGSSARASAPALDASSFPSTSRSIPHPARRPFDARRFGWALVAMWLAGVLLRVAGMIRQFVRVQRLRRRAEPDGAPASSVRSPEGVRVALHPDVPVPMVTGFWNPLVLLPVAMADRPGADLRLAIAHEVSHVRRGDLWLSWIPALAETLFWFHPLVSLCAREYVQACEEACDEDALRATGAHPYEYGRLLLALGVDRRWAAVGALSFGSPSPSQLIRRLSMLKHFSPLKPRFRTAALGLMCAFGLVGLAPIRLVPTAGGAAGPKPTGPLARAASTQLVTGSAVSFGARDATPAPGSSAEAAPLAIAAVSDGGADALATTMEHDPPLAPDDPEVTADPGDENDQDLDSDSYDDDWDYDDDDAVPPTPPTPPTPRTPPTWAWTPRPPRPPIAPIAPLSPLSPRASRAKGHDYGYHYSYDSADDPSDRFAYVLVHGDQSSMTGSGNTLDWKEVRRLRDQQDGDFLWVRANGRRYLIQDPDILAQIEEAFAPQNEIGEKQSRLGAAQSRIGVQQSRIGVEQSKIGEQQSEIGRRQGEVAMEMARRQTRGERTRDLEAVSGELSDQMDLLGREQERLGSRMEPLSHQMQELSGQMEELGRQMAQVSRTASRKARSLIDQAIRDGEAKPLR